MIADIGRLVELLGRNIISVQFPSCVDAVVKCRHGICFMVSYRDVDCYDLYEYDGGRGYVLGEHIQTINKVFDRMCKEHGCLIE